jgi:hypothetical protein
MRAAARLFVDSNLFWNIRIRDNLATSTCAILPRSPTRMKLASPSAPKRRPLPARCGRSVPDRDRTKYTQIARIRTKRGNRTPAERPKRRKIGSLRGLKALKGNQATELQANLSVLPELIPIAARFGKEAAPNPCHPPPCAGHAVREGLRRAGGVVSSVPSRDRWSTAFEGTRPDVDGRNESGHDAECVDKIFNPSPYGSATAATTPRRRKTSHLPHHLAAESDRLPLAGDGDEADRAGLAGLETRRRARGNVEPETLGLGAFEFQRRVGFEEMVV